MMSDLLCHKSRCLSLAEIIALLGPVRIVPCCVDPVSLANKWKITEGLENT